MGALSPFNWDYLKKPVWAPAFRCRLCSPIAKSETPSCGGFGKIPSGTETAQREMNRLKSSFLPLFCPLTVPKRADFNTRQDRAMSNLIWPQSWPCLNRRQEKGAWKRVRNFLLLCVISSKQLTSCGEDFRHITSENMEMYFTVPIPKRKRGSGWNEPNNRTRLKYL